jgi:hypothetical protein
VAWVPAGIETWPAPGGLALPVGSWLRADTAEDGDDIAAGNEWLGGFTAMGPAAVAMGDALLARTWTAATGDGMGASADPPDALPSRAIDDYFRLCGETSGDTPDDQAAPPTTLPLDTDVSDYS